MQLCKITLNRCKLQQTKSIGDAALCSTAFHRHWLWASATDKLVWVMRPFAKLQSSGRCGLSSSYSCDGDETFCQITLDRCKLQLQKSSGDAAFCRITAAMMMWPFVPIYSVMSMRLFVKLESWGWCDLSSSNRCNGDATLVNTLDRCELQQTK